MRVLQYHFAWCGPITGTSAVVSLAIGVMGFGAGNLMFSDSKSDVTVGQNNENIQDVLNYLVATHQC